MKKLGDIVSKMISRNIKDSIKFEIVLDNLQDKVREQATQKLEEELPKQISNIGQVKVLGDLKKILKNTNQQLNSIQSTVVQVNSSMGIFTTISTTTENTLKAIEGIVTAIKLIPTPTAPIAIPVNLITILSDSLDILSDLIKHGKGAIGFISPSINSIQQILSTVLDKLNEIIAFIEIIITKIALIEAMLLFGNNPTDEQIENQNQQILNEVGAFNQVSNNFYPPTDNTTNEDDLLARLLPNSLDPLIYKGWRLLIEYELEGNPPKRRIRGNSENPEGGLMTLYNHWHNSLAWSYGSLEFLIFEIKFRIDIIGTEDEEYFKDYYGIVDIEDSEIRTPPPTFDEEIIEAPPKDYILNIIRNTLKENYDFSQTEYTPGSIGGKIFVDGNELINDQIILTSYIQDQYKVSVSFKIEPSINPECTFLGWGGDNIDLIPNEQLQDEEITLIINDNINLITQFLYLWPKFELKAFASEGGKIEGLVNSQQTPLNNLILRQNSEVVIEAIPDKFYIFKQWTVNEEIVPSDSTSGISHFLKFNITEDKYIQAEFEIK